MKKVVGFCLVMCLCASSVFADQNFQSDRKKVKRSTRCETLIKELNLNEKQAAEFREVHSEYSEKIREEHKEMMTNRKEAKEKLRDMRKEKNEEMKKILTEEQFKQYQAIMEKQMKKNRRSK